MRNERKIESRLVKKIEAKGGLCWKWISPSMTGVPDRIVMYKGIHLVELKDPEGGLAPKQQSVINMLEKRSIKVHVLDSIEAVDEFVEALG